MRLVIAQPDRILFEESASSVSYEAGDGARGILPRHTDLVTTLSPGILIVTPEDGRGSETLFAVDRGLVVKQGETLYVATRRGVKGENLSSLQETVENDYRNLDEQEKRSRSALRVLEADFLRQFVEMESPDNEPIG